MTKSKIIGLGLVATGVCAYTSNTPVEVAIIGFTITIIAGFIADNMQTTGKQ